MNHLVRLWLAALVLLIFAFPAAPQSNEAKKAPGKNPSSDGNSAKDVEADRAIKERRAQARSLLVSLASDARSFRDQRLRARSLARIADALWEVDAEQARALFRKAWEAAEAADKDGQQRLQEEISAQKAKTGGGFAVSSPPNVRGEVLRLVARRDRGLGEEFLEKLRVDRQQEAANAAESTRRNPLGTPEALRQRLNLAQQLLDAGDVERALQFADPALGFLNMSSLNFLSNLRDKDPAAADQRYAAMLANAAVDLQSDANTVSLLSSYIFTPHFFVTFSGNGTSSSQMSSIMTPANVAPELQAAFFRTAAQVLSRPLPPPEQDQSSSGIDGKYLVIKRLLPLFEQYAPPEITASMRAQLEALTTVVNDSARQRDDEWMRKGIKPEQKSQDREQSLLEQIEHAKTAAERDGLYLQLAFFAARSGDIRAREFVDKIEDSELRQKARAYIDPSLAMQAIDKKQTAQALELARIGDLTHIQRVWVLSQVSKLLAKTDHDKCLALIEDAASETRRIDGSDPDRPRALMAVANALLTADRARAWDAAFDAVKASNSADGFTGEDGGLVIQFQTKGSSSVRSDDAPDFDVAGIFRALATDDYDRAVQLARGFQGETPRAMATIAIARSVLEQKQPRGAEKK
jgi:hypothetical protein